MTIDLQSRQFKIALLIIGGLIVLLLVFQAGSFVGFKKAKFSCHWAENYEKNFIGPGKGFGKKIGRELAGKDLFNAHGIAGAIIKADDEGLVIKEPNGTEKAVSVNGNTVINRFRDTLTTADLKIGDKVVIIGSANELGVLEAKLIRVLPPTDLAPPPILPTN